MQKELPVTDEINDETLEERIEKLRALLSPLLGSASAGIPPGLIAELLDFSSAAKAQQRFVQAGETARSLASFLHGSGNPVSSGVERQQFTVLIENLLREFAEDDGLPEFPPASAQAVDRRPLVTPIAPSSATVNNRIALYVDSGALLVMLQETLLQAGFEPVVIHSLEELAATELGQGPAAIIADLGLCQLNPCAADVFSSLRRRFSPSPHLFCIAASSDIPGRLEAVRLGATRFLPQPVDAGRLVAILKGVTVQVPRQAFRVVMVEDDPFLGEVYREGLVDAGIETLIISDPLKAPALIAEFQPDLVVSDLFMPGCNGFELLALLRQDDALADTPIMLLSSEPDATRRLEALDLGADDFLTKPVDMSLLVTTVIARAKRARMLKRSRSEYRRILQKMREMEQHLPDNLSGKPEAAVELDMLFEETINMDDFVVGEIGRKGPGA
jgi:DNA-binding response OmpR family regulator